MLFDIVFEGGGMRGVAFLGALDALARNGHTVGRVMGASVGGFTAALLAAGHDVDSIQDAIFDPENGRLTLADALKPHPQFTPQAIRDSATRGLLRDVDAALVPNLVEDAADGLLARVLMRQPSLHPLFSVLEHMSLRDDAGWLEWLRAQLNARAGGEDWAALSLRRFYEKTGRSLTVIASDVTNPAMLVLNHTTAPDLPLLWAVRMTTSVPFLFPPVVWREEWGLYRNKRLDGHLIVDGALLSQFPLELFLSDSDEVQAMMGPREAGDNVIGLLLDETRAVPGLTPSEASGAVKFTAVPGIRFAQMMLKTLLSNANSATSEALKSRVIHLPALGVDVYGFDLDRAYLQPLINTAYNVTQQVLNGWQRDPRTMLTTFEKKYVQVVAEKFVVGGDYYSIGDISNSSGIAIGKDAGANVAPPTDDP